MAVIKIWKIDQRLDNVIGYATKDEKFDINTYLGLNKVIKYLFNKIGQTVNENN